MSFLKGYIPWNKGKTTPQCGVKGRVPWNKGLLGVMKAWNKGIKTGPNPKLSDKLKGKVAWNKGKKLGFVPKMAFKKGFSPWNKGVRGSQKAWNMGIPCKEETRLKISKSLIGHTPWNKGKEYLAIRGEKNSSWNGGKSFEEYGSEFSDILKETIRKRDNNRCQECFKHQDELFSKSGLKYKLNIHHIDYNKKNNDPTNLISLCRNCHVKTNFGREEWTDYFRGEKHHNE